MHIVTFIQSLYTILIPVTRCVFIELPKIRLLQLIQVIKHPYLLLLIKRLQLFYKFFNSHLLCSLRRNCIPPTLWDVRESNPTHQIHSVKS